MNIKAREKRPLFFVAGAMALMAIVLVIGGLTVHHVVEQSFSNINAINETLQTSGDLLRAQLDEETGIRGVAATNNPIFLEPYTAAQQEFPVLTTRLRDQLQKVHDTKAALAFEDLIFFHTNWQAHVVGYVLKKGIRFTHPTAEALRIELHGKFLVDHIRADFNDVNVILIHRRASIIQSTRHSIDMIGAFVIGSILSFIIGGIMILRYQYVLSLRLESSRLRAREIQSELATKQHIAEVLQEALSQRPLPAMPAVRFSATYVPATEQSKVGGDWYDAIELSHNRVLFIIGDVAGHGIEAAVGMSRARQAFIGSALKNPDPAHVLINVNAELCTQGSPMVTAVCGLADSERYEFIFATAGHPPPLLIEPGQKPRLLQCGGLPLGVLPNAQYQTKVVQTIPSAMLVLYTDGAVEHSHDVLEGESLLIEAADLCRDVDIEPATAIHRAIFNGRSAGDDVAILTMGFTPELQTGMKISAEHLQSSFSGRIRRGPRRLDSIIPHDSFSHAPYGLGAA